MEEETRLKEHEKLYQYWADAGLVEKTGMTAAQFFSKFARKHVPKVFDEYHYDKDVLENSRVSRNNEILSLLMHRLADPETLETRLTPGGFANASAAAKKLRILTNEKYLKEVLDGGVIDYEVLDEAVKDKNRDFKETFDVLDPSTLVYYNQQNQIAGTLIGVFANHNSNHMFASMAERLELSAAIEMCGHSYKDLIHPPKGVDPSLTTAEFLAASVDAVKDPVLNFLNLNRFTADTGALLARLGYTSEEIGLLFNQPIIKELCEILANDMYADVEGAIKSLYTKYDVKFPKFSSSDVAKGKLMSNLASYTQSTNKDNWINSNKESQISALIVFSKASNYAGELSRFIGTTKFTASNSLGSTWGNLYHTRYVVKKYIKDSLNANKENRLIVKAYDGKDREASLGISDNNLDYSNQKEYFENLMDNPFAFEQCNYDMLKLFMGYLCTSDDSKERIFPFESPIYTKIRDGLNSLTRSEVLDEDTINSIHDDILVWILSNTPGSVFDGNKLIYPDQESEPVTQKDYYTKYYPQILNSIKDGKFPFVSTKVTNFLKSMFTFESSEDTGEISTVYVKNISRFSKIQKEDFSIIWEELASSDNPSDRVIARDLFLYCYYVHGFDFSPKSFIHLATPSVKDNLFIPDQYDPALQMAEEASYIKFLNNTLLNGPILDMQGESANRVAATAMKMYIRNHTDNYRFVYTPRKQEETETLDGIFKHAKNGIVEIPLNEKASYYSKIVFYKGENGTKVIPAIMWKGELYEVLPLSNGINYNENPGVIERVAYRKVSILGEEGKYKSYSEENSDAKELDKAKMALMHQVTLTNKEEVQDLIAEEFGTTTNEKLYMNYKGEMQKRCK